MVLGPPTARLQTTAIHFPGERDDASRCSCGLFRAFLMVFCWTARGARGRWPIRDRHDPIPAWHAPPRLCGGSGLVLGLADHGLRLQVPLLVGLVVDPLVPTKEPQESTTVTPAEIIYHRRVQVLDRAGQTSVTEACRTFGVSRTTYYRWAGRAQRYGLAALLPKGRRPPVMPTATPPDQVEAVLAEAVARPTIGARRLVDHLADRGVRLSASGVQKILRPPPARPTRPAGGRPGPAHRRDDRHLDHRRPRTARSGSATSPPGPVTWSPWTPSMSASSRASGRSGSSPRSTPPPAMRSAPWSPGTSRPATRPASSTTSPSAWPASGSSSAGC